MRELSGQEIADYIKQRQEREAMAIASELGRRPRLDIIQTKDDKTINLYVGLKQKYGEDIGVDVHSHSVSQTEVLPLIEKLNSTPEVDGIIVQLPLEDRSQTEAVINAVSAEKDVDGLAEGSEFDPATPTAILWLFSGRNIALNGKTITVVGQGSLVGAPLTRMLQESGVEPQIADENTPDLAELTLKSDIIITATGVAGLITSDLIPEDAIVVDAGTSSESGVVKGDVADEVREREDVLITPKKGGVGPLTVCALFDNVLRAASTN